MENCFALFKGKFQQFEYPKNGENLKFLRHFLGAAVIFNILINSKHN